MKKWGLTCSTEVESLAASLVLITLSGNTSLGLSKLVKIVLKYLFRKKYAYQNIG